MRGISWAKRSLEEAPLGNRGKKGTEAEVVFFELCSKNLKARKNSGARQGHDFFSELLQVVGRSRDEKLTKRKWQKQRITFTSVENGHSRVNENAFIGGLNCIKVK